MQIKESNDEYLEKLLLIRSFPGMNTAPAQALSLMAERSTLKEFPAGTKLYIEDQPVKYLYLIVSGKIAIKRKGKILAELGQREVCGAISTFAESDEGPEAITESQVSVLEIESRDTQEIFMDHFELMILGLLSMSVNSFMAGALTNTFPRTLPKEIFLIFNDSDFSESLKLSLIVSALGFMNERWDVLTEMAKLFEDRTVAKGESLWKVGMPLDGIYLLVNGSFEARMKALQFPLALGECLGLRESLCGIPVGYEAFALLPGRFLYLSKDHFLDVLEDHSELAMGLLKELAREVVDLRKQFSYSKPLG